jgi:hypothetical protein
VDPCIIGSDLVWRRFTLVPGATVWEQAEKMQTAQADLATLKKQGEKLQKQCGETASMLKSINETMKNLGAWVP